MPLTPSAQPNLTVLHLVVEIPAGQARNLSDLPRRVTTVEFRIAVSDETLDGPRFEVYRALRAELEHLAPDLANALATALVP